MQNQKIKYFDAHMHWFDKSSFADTLAENIGDKSDKKYYLEAYGKTGLCGGILMGNGDIFSQGEDIPKNFYYCLGLDIPWQVDKVDTFLQIIENHLQRSQCVGVKLYPGYIQIYPEDGHYEHIYELLEKYNKVLAVHTGTLASLNGKLKYAHPLHLDDVATDHPNLRIVMCHFGNPFLSEAAAVIERNQNVYADLSGLLEGKFLTEELLKIQEPYINTLKTWINYLGDNSRFIFGTDWPAVKCDEYVKFISSLFPKESLEDVLINNALEVYQCELS